MAEAQSLLDIKPARPDVVLAGLRSDIPEESKAAGLKLARNAAKFGVDVRDYLMLAVQTDYEGSQVKGLNGYEATLAHLKLPVRDSIAEGIILQAASETFETYPGTRAMFPPVIDDIVRWTYRQDQMQSVAPMLASSRTISGVEMLMTIVEDSASGEENQTFTIPELGRIPVRTIRTSEQTVKMYKHGSGIRTSYEFNRRARLDVLTPFAARVTRELELGKVRAATGVMLNGDGNGSAAPAVTQAGFTVQVGTAGAAGFLSYQHLLAWLVARAQAGAPVDTVVGNFGAAYQWMRMFQPTTANTQSAADAIRTTTGMGVAPFGMMLPSLVNFVVSSAMPNNMLLGITKNETLEEMKEAGGDISEIERGMLNQSITYLKTEVSGYRLLFKDTRQTFDYTDAG
jgi:hypothetical protein